MAGELRSISSARLAVIPAAERDARYASAVGGMAGRARLQPVAEEDARCGQVGSLDLAVGLYVGMGDGEEALAGMVAVRETITEERNVADPSTPGEPVFNRLFVVEALTLRPEMQKWRPSVRVLLAATAAVLIATVAHDPSYRTYVACRMPIDDGLAMAAVEAIGGRELAAPSGDALAKHALAFLDGDAAGRAAGVVLGFMNGGDASHALEAGGRERPCWAVLSISFPRAIRVLEEELVELRAGRVTLGWRPPMVVGDDASVPNGGRSGAATV